MVVTTDNHLWKFSASGSSRGAVAALRITLFLLLMLAGWSAHGAPQAELWPRWEAHDPSSVEEVDHSRWGVFLQRHLITDTADGVNRVRYAAVAEADRRRLQAYIRDLEAVAVSDLNRPEQLAYWTNLYNAVTVELILDRYPVESIRDIGISGNILNRHPWDAPLVTVEGESLTLNDIEHRIMRPIWEDPRIHYVVNCASIGCPNLLPVPFEADTWDALADEAARDYINHPRGVDFSGRRPALSSIYDWYQVDFGDDIEGVIAHILLYAEGSVAEEARRFAVGGHRGRVNYEYDWSLNEP
jgi:hypothetical protein